MLFQVIEENGVKKINPLTADAGAGAPVGTIIAMYKKSSPSGYLYLDGSTFDQNAYPLLYAYLGSNVLPDYREFALVGAEQNTTSSNITDHDIYTEGQEKDDQLQEHRHGALVGSGGNVYTTIATAVTTTAGTNNYLIQGAIEARAGTVTRGKRKAVYFYIKATSGLSENAQDNVINTLNEQRSYSTEEHLTGKKWIDGKDIWEKTVTGLSFGDTANAWTNSGATLSNCDTLINGIALRTRDNAVLKNFSFSVSGNNIQYYTFIDFPNCDKVTLEYTKTN